MTYQHDEEKVVYKDDNTNIRIPIITKVEFNVYKIPSTYRVTVEKDGSYTVEEDEDEEDREKLKKDEQTSKKSKLEIGDNVRIIEDHVIAQITEKDNLLDAYRTNYKNCWWHGNQLEYVSEDELEKLMQNESTLMDEDTQRKI